MFTGIISHTGSVQKTTKNSLAINVSKALTKKLSVGDSVSVNGVCLTLVRLGSVSTRRTTSHVSLVTFDIMPETCKKTNLGSLKKQNVVNLEMPATPITFLSGHVVQGHIDGVGKIRKIKRQKDKKRGSYIFSIQIPKKFHKYLVEKGPIAIDGISLTIIDIMNNGFTVGIIPYTMQLTNLHKKKINDAVNIEIDIVGKYVFKAISNKQ